MSDFESQTVQLLEAQEMSAQVTWISSKNDINNQVCILGEKS